MHSSTATGATARIADQEHTFDVPKTDGWYKTVFVRAGRFSFEQPGVYHLTLEPADAETWKAVNAWQVRLAPVD